MSDHLWEFEHEYHGPECDYYAPGAAATASIDEHDCWQDFVDNGMHNAPEGLNLLYRWDWWALHLEDPEEYPDGAQEHRVELFWMLQRKGIMRRSEIKVTEDDEPAVRAWLANHAEVMRKLWAPLMP